jgi:superfamily I DNA/RNA helicase
MLVVAGPGAGKSFLFMDRIKYWLPLNAGDSIYVSSFVRKLCKDLHDEIEANDEIGDEDQQRVTVTTLHTAARSLLERNHGTATQAFDPHIKVISSEWENVVWQDVLKFHPELDARVYSHNGFARQLHTEELDGSEKWIVVRDTYALLSRFYNAVGFADMIVLAREALEQSPELNQHLLWIIDEFQDFNRAEEHLIRAIVETARAVLIAGDDELALYQQLKSSLPEIIVSYYEDRTYANAMLPYCSRCSYYNCLAASSFIAKHRVTRAIGKVYLPFRRDEGDPKVQVVATATPSSAVDYIENFVDDHREELEAHRAQMEADEETDPFLLILSPAKKLDFYGWKNADKRLRDLVEQWSVVRLGRSPDYRRVASYASVTWDATDNFATRKVVKYEDFDPDSVHELLVEAINHDRRLADVVAERHPEVLERCNTTAGVLESDELTDEQKVDALSELFELEDSDRLVTELGMHRIQPRSVIGADEGDEAIETEDVAAPVELLTMVGAKGLSAQHVIVIGCDDVNMRRTSPLTFFVALTRARKSQHLIVSAKARGTEAHPFILDLPAECCDYKVHLKTGHVTRKLAGADDLKEKMGVWTRPRASRTSTA